MQPVARFDEDVVAVLASPTVITLRSALGMSRRKITLGEKRFEAEQCFGDPLVLDVAVEIQR